MYNFRIKKLPLIIGYFLENVGFCPILQSKLGHKTFVPKIQEPPNSDSSPEHFPPLKLHLLNIDRRSINNSA